MFVFNKTIISDTLVGYDMIIANSGHTTCWLIIISYPMCAHGIIVKYTGAKGDMTTVEHCYMATVENWYVQQGMQQNVSTYMKYPPVRT